MLELKRTYEVTEEPVTARVKPHGHGSARITFPGIKKFLGKQVVIGVLKDD